MILIIIAKINTNYVNIVIRSIIKVFVCCVIYRYSAGVISIIVHTVYSEICSTTLSR